MELLLILVFYLKQMLLLSMHQVWWHGGNMHTLLGEGYWIIMASVEGLLRRFVLDLQSCYVVKQFLIATGKLLNPDPRRISSNQLKSLSMAPVKAGSIIIGAPVRYCYYCSAGIARTVYTISTSPAYLLPRRRHAHRHDTTPKSAAHCKHHAQAHCRKRHHFRLKGQGQMDICIPRDMYQQDPDEDSTFAPSRGRKLVNPYINNNDNGVVRNNINNTYHHHNPSHSRNVHSIYHKNTVFHENDAFTAEKQLHADSFHTNNSITDSYCDLLPVVPEFRPDENQLCPFHAPHVLGEDPKYKEILIRYNTRLSLYRKMPWKAISRLWGQVNQLELPVWLRAPTLGLYIWMFQCKLHEASVTDLTYYRNLSEFFRRKLRPGLRPIDGAHVLTSSADGTILHLSEVEGGVLEQVKGVAYSLSGFLGPKTGLLFQKDLEVDEGCVELLSDEDYATSLLTNPRDNALYHCITYLAPGDYHRFHSPTDWTIYGRRHFPGELFSVKPGVARWLQGLFNYNERAVYTGRWRYGFFSMTAVGATNVGSINVEFDKELYTNCPDDKNHEVFYDASFLSKKRNGVHIKKGELFGDFNLGSTIVLIFEAPKKFKFTAREGQKVKVGQGIGLCRRRRKMKK